MQHRGMGTVGGLILILLVFAGVWFLYQNWDWVNANFLHVYKTVPDFRLKDYLDRYHERSEFSGRPTVIHSWEADCSQCADELRDLASLQEELGDKIYILAVNRGNSFSAAKNFTDRLGVSHRLFIFLDPQSLFYKAIGGTHMPETIFADAEGKIIDRKKGHMQLNEIRQRIERIL